ncbi:hypothetical protein BC938DRAFT_479127, partial [Jimgerdemannia flammicorona]
MVEGVRRLLQGVGVIKVQATKDGRFLVLLDDVGRLSLWDKRSLIRLYQYEDVKISDFNIMPILTSPNATLTTTSGSTVVPSSSQFSVIILTAPDSVTQCRFIEVVSLPDYTVTHHVPVAAKCWLVKPQEGSEVRWW